MTLDNLINYAVWLGSKNFHPNTIEQYLGGIGRYFRKAGVSDWEHMRTSSELKEVLDGIRKSYGESHCTESKNENSIMTINTMATLCHKADTLEIDPIDRELFKAILSIGFWGLHRLDELVDADEETVRRQRSHRRILLSSVVITKTSEGMELEYWLPGHKADRFGVGNKISLEQYTDDSVCPVRRTMEYLLRRSEKRLETPAFLVTSEGLVPTRSWFMSRVREYSGCQTWGSKSLRAGGATWLAENGYTESAIKERGRWRSSAYKRYIKVKDKNHKKMK